LRFLYCNKFNFDDGLLVFKLLDFADKYLQDDLNERCLDYLQLNINSKTALPIFEEAYARNLEKLVIWCVNHFKNNLGLANKSELIQSLLPKQNGYPRELRDRVLD